MRNTESDFGLISINGQVSADGGETFLPKFSEMSAAEFEELVSNIEYHIEKALSESDREDLREILDV